VAKGGHTIARVVGARVINVEQVISAGCRYFVRHGTVDMDELAVVLAVSRATLYRVINSRDRLLGEVLWRLAEEAIDQARARRTRDGIEGVLDVVRGFANELLDAESFRHFIATEPEAATRVLFTPTGGGLHRRGVKAVTELFDEAAPSGPWIVDDRDNVAYLLVRIVESLCFSELLAGTPPDRDLAERTIRALLVQACSPRQSRTQKVVEAASCLMWTSVPAMLWDGRLSLGALAGL
jgi:AcrR family transcriptional regulator